nr:fibroblast growth factor receptor 1 [Biomphalaria glabrata]
MSVVVALTCAVLAVCAKQCDKTEGRAVQCNTAKGGKRSKNSPKHSAPQWETKPTESHLDIRENTNVDLSCAVRGQPEPGLYWLNGRKRIDSNNTSKYRLKDGHLKIFNVKWIDAGPYTCVAENQYGQLNFTFEIRVLENMPLNDIAVVDQPVNQTAQLGDTVVFQCNSDDYPKPNISWTRQRDGHHGLEVVHSNKEKKLVIENVKKEDQGLYICNIENSKTRVELVGSLRVIEPGENLPFEPKCSMHLKREMYIDHATGCRTSEAVDLYYCMGTCGRSYFMPKIVVTENLSKTERADDVIAQTCQCCIGKLETMKIVEMECPLRQKSLAYIPVLHRCECQPCGGIDRKQSKNAQGHRSLRVGKTKNRKKKKKPPIKTKKTRNPIS